MIGLAPTIAPIAGDGVTLRPWRPEDADFLVRACNDPQVSTYLSGMPSPYTPEDADWWIHTGSRSDGHLAFAITDSSTGDPVGGAGLARHIPIRAQVEVGYWVASWARRRGIATAATTALADWAFAEREIHRVELMSRADNPASLRVALGAGFTQEGVRRLANQERNGTWQDLVAFARLATDPPGPAGRVLPDFPDDRLTDGVVTLRPLRPADAASYAALHQLPEVIEVSIGELTTPESAAVLCARAEWQWLAGARADCAITDDSGRFAGHIGMHFQGAVTGQAMIGYSLLPEFRGRGLTARAARLLTEWAFAETGVVRMIAGTNPQNIASQRTLERAGFTREAFFKARLPARDGTRTDDIQFVRLHPNLLDT